MATTARQALPVSQAQADEATAIAQAVCRNFGVDATVEVVPAYDPELPPYRMAMVEVTVSPETSTETFQDLIGEVGAALARRGLQWPDVPMTFVLW